MDSDEIVAITYSYLYEGDEEWEQAWLMLPLQGAIEVATWMQGTGKHRDVQIWRHPLDKENRG